MVAPIHISTCQSCGVANGSLNVANPTSPNSDNMVECTYPIIAISKPIKGLVCFEKFQKYWVVAAGLLVILQAKQILPSYGFANLCRCLHFERYVNLQVFPHVPIFRAYRV